MRARQAIAAKRSGNVVFAGCVPVMFVMMDSCPAGRKKWIRIFFYCTQSHFTINVYNESSNFSLILALFRLSFANALVMSFLDATHALVKWRSSSHFWHSRSFSYWTFVPEVHKPTLTHTSWHLETQTYAMHHLYCGNIVNSAANWHTKKKQMRTVKKKRGKNKTHRWKQKCKREKEKHKLISKNKKRGYSVRNANENGKWRKYDE